MTRRTASLWFGRLLLAGIVALASSAASETASAARLVFDVVEIEGEVQRPQVSVFITRQNLNDPYDLELKESFLPKIVEALDDDPF